MEALQVRGKFDSGKIVWTCGVNNQIADDSKFAKFVFDSLRKHLNGDWGDLGEEDKASNEEALREGSRLLSAYNHNGVKIWIITEADRSSTCVLFPDEY